MSAFLKHGLAREALRLAADSHRSCDEKKCRALLELLETSQTLGSSLRSELARNKLTENGFRILARIISQEPAAVLPADLAAELDLTRQSVSAVLGRLEVSGLVIRQRDERDHRAFSVRATPRGIHSFKHAVRCLLDAIARLMSVLDNGDITQLDRACVRLRASSIRPSSS